MQYLTTPRRTLAERALKHRLHLPRNGELKAYLEWNSQGERSDRLVLACESGLPVGVLLSLAKLPETSYTPRVGDVLRLECGTQCMFYVEPSRRRRGIASGLLNHFVTTHRLNPDRLMGQLGSRGSRKFFQGQGLQVVCSFNG